MWQFPVPLKGFNCIQCVVALGAEILHETEKRKHKDVYADEQHVAGRDPVCACICVTIEFVELITTYMYVIVVVIVNIVIAIVIA